MRKVIQLNHLIILIILLPCSLLGQDFKKWKDDLARTEIVRYYNQNAQFIIQKTSSQDNINIKYEIGLIIFRPSVKTDDFMFDKAQIILEDNSILSLTDLVQTQYVISGKYMLFIKHILTEYEMNNLKSKKISKFRIYQYENTFDKWQKETILKAINQIVSE